MFLQNEGGGENKTESDDAQTAAPLFRLDHANTTSLPFRINATKLLKQEYNRLISKRRNEEILKIEQALRGPTNPGLPSEDRPNTLPYKGQLMTRLRKLKCVFE